MTPEHWILIAVLSASTIGLRLVGYLAGSAMMARPFWRRVFDVFPGCLVTALVASALANGGPGHVIAALVALAAAIVTRNIIVTMLLGMGAFVLAGMVI
ncbi:MAG: AzlD domain-containing protein [Rhodobacteraceae bacterium]|nr:AzlD domain-containing protein [Paracoccaceae bacterium]